jgi:hypothetical protein
MENPRKKLYSSLVASADPDVKKHFSQWSADEFDKKLSEDEEFQKDLFLDLRDIGMAKDEATFAKQYLAQPAPAPAAPAAKAAPVAKSVEAVKEPSTYGALDITNYGPIGAIKKGVSGLVSAAKQFIGVKSEDAKYEEAQKKSQSGSVSGFAGGEDLRILSEYENSAKDWKLKQGQKEEAGKSQMLYTGMGAPTYQPALGFTPEQEKEYKKSQQNYGQVKEKANQVINSQVSKIVEKAKIDKTAYKTDKYGKSVPDPEWVMKEARSIATKGGAEIGGYAENHLRNTITAGLVQEKRAPEIQKEFLKLNKNKTAAQEIQELFDKGVEPMSTFQNRYTNAVKNAEKIATEEYRPKVEAVTNEYKSAIETYKQNVASDPSIKQAVDEYDAQNIAKLQEGVNKGALTVEQANAMLTGKDSMDARNAYINKMVDEKHGKPLGEAYNKYLSDVSTLNNRYNARMRRQSEEQKNYFDNQYKKNIAAAKKNFNVPQYLLDKYERLYKQADEIVSKREGAFKNQSDVNASIWDNFISSTMKGLGEGIQSTAYTLGMEDVASFGDLLAKNFETSDLTINSWNDVGFGKEGLTKFANSAGSILGRMGPGLAGSAAVAAASGGLGLGFLPSLFLTSVPSAAFETADIMGSIEQQVLAKGGDIVAAKKASERALQSQLLVAPLYALESLSFFPKFLKWAGKGKYAGLNIAKRAGAGFATNIVTETFQEVPQNVFEEAILDGKDPTFKELIERTTFEKIKNTSASVASLGLLMGAGPQIVDSSKDAIAKRAAAGYFANNILGQASHPALQAQNQTQFLTQLADEKGERFAAQMVNVLFQKGNIDKVKAEALANKLANFQNFKQTTLGQSENQVVRQAGFMLFDKYMEAKNSKNEQAQESALAALNDYARTGNAELVMLQMPDGSFKVYNYDDLNSLMDDEDFQQASRESNEKYGAVFEITPLVQTQEGLQNPKLQQIIQRFDDIRKEAPKDTKTEAEDTTEVEEIDDAKILEGQKRSGFEAPKLFEIIPVEAAAVLDAVRSKEQGVTPDELSGASNAIYQLHKMYEKMRSSTTRNLTLDQIDDITGELEQAITELENQKTRLAIGDEQMDSLQQQDTESNQTIDTVTAPTEQAPQVAPVTAPGVVVEAPAAPQAAPEAAQAEAPTPAKPKAKVNVFTDEEVIDSFSQKESEIYDRLLFDGDEDLANQMIRDKRRQLVGKEVELLDVGKISEKVRQSFAKAGIDIELLSADEFVQKLKEAGESASRTQEGVFDDNRGKIFINKDALKLGWGTTVVWHEAIHPIMNIIHNSNKALYDKIHKGILANAKANPRGGMQSVINDVEKVYTKEKGYTDADRKDEIIVEALARLSAGTMSFSELQPTLRQQFIDLINRIGRILGLSKAEVSDMKAIKDLAKKITETIKEGRDLSEIVGAENIGKYKRQGALAASLGERGEMSLQKNGTGIALEGNEKVVKGKNAPTVTTAQGFQEDYSLDDILATDLAPTSRTVTLALTIAKGEASYKDKKSDNRIVVTLPYKNEAVAKKIEKLKKKYSEVEGSSKQAKEEKEKIKNQINVEAKKILQDFTDLMTQNILALYDTLAPKFMEISKQWYVGANRMANALANKYGKTIEQTSGIIAALSPQKDWFNNVSAAERVMDIMANHSDTKLTKEIVDKAVDYNTDKSTKKHKPNSFAVDLLDFFNQYGEVSINDLNESGRSLQDQGVILRAIDHAINSPKVAITDPNGKFIGYDSTPIRWNGFNEIAKAIFMYRNPSIEAVNSQLGDGNKVRNFYNNIVDPFSKTPYVTADTHAISVALAAPMSAEDASGVGLFLGSKEPLYAIVKDAYIKAASIAGILPREMQSITWEAQRVGINNKNRTEDQKESNFAYIAETRNNSQTPYERATELIARNISTNPEWGKDRGIVTQRLADEIREGAELRAKQRISEIFDLRGRARGELGGAAAELGGRATGRTGTEKGTITQKSLGGREKQGTFESGKEDEKSRLRSERTGDRGGRPEGGAIAPLEGAPSVPGVNGPDPQLVAVAERYAKANGIPLKRQSEYVKVDVNRAKRIAEAYAEMKHDPQNPKVKEAYKDLIKQTIAQYEALRKAGYKFWFIDTNIPSNKEYAETPFNALRDIRKNKEMGVFPTTDGFGSSDLDVSDNPLMEETKYKWPVGGMDGELKPVLANDLFRAVHDAFGHGLEGAAFRARGEENAWQAHIRLFTGAAQGAITSETRGQNSWLNFNSNILKDVVGAEKAKELHPDNWETITVGEHNRNAKTDDTIFADQKTGLMPEWTWTEGRAGDMQDGGTQASLGERQAAPSFAELDEILDMSPVKSRAARVKLIDQYGKETVDRMIEISRNFTKIINGLEEQGVVEKDCP